MSPHNDDDPRSLVPLSTLQHTLYRQLYPFDISPDVHLMALPVSPSSHHPQPSTSPPSPVPNQLLRNQAIVNVRPVVRSSHARRAPPVPVGQLQQSFLRPRGPLQPPLQRPHRSQEHRQSLPDLQVEGLRHVVRKEGPHYQPSSSAHATEASRLHDLQETV
ncbi:hypothetical protein AcV5_005469 [Taiwanofungus camphoratus]|nr:hypothetical protein AcV5_005469 [Antrodia cinnamomea]